MRWPAWPRRRDAAGGVGGHRCPGWPSWSPRRPRPAWSATPQWGGASRDGRPPTANRPRSPRPGARARRPRRPSRSYQWYYRGHRRVLPAWWGEDQPELRSGGSTSYRGHTDIVGRSGLSDYSVVPGGARTGPSPPPGAASMTETVQRAAQMALPSSSVRVMPHTCKVLPTRTGVAVAVRCPSRRERRWLALSSMPTTPLPARRRGRRRGWRPTRPAARRHRRGGCRRADAPSSPRAGEGPLARCGLEHLDAEEAVDAGGRVDPGQRRGPAAEGGVVTAG